MEMRRKKLSDLLLAEEDSYKKELISIQETPDQVRAKMERRLKELMDIRESERLQKVAELTERKFYADADELRKNDSEAFAIECYLEQENQMLDKLRKRNMDKKEEEIFVKLNELDIKKKDEQEKKQAEEIEKKKQETYKFLEWQKITQKENEEKLKAISNIEKERIHAQWVKDNQREEQERIDKIKQNIEVYKTIQEFNRQEEGVKKLRSDIERKKDRELIDNTLNKERALDEIDRKEKERKKQEFEQNKKYLEFVMNQKKEAEAWMDQIVKDEADKKWKKEQDNWMKQENARIELLKQVYKEREEAIKHKKGVSVIEREAVARERVALDAEIAAYIKRCEEIKVEDAIKRKAHQDDLRYQMKERITLKDKENQDKIYEERAAKLWEIDYLKKINFQKDLHMKRLAEIKARGMSEN